LHYKDFPKDLPTATKFLKSVRYKGTKESVIERPASKLDIKINKHVIEHNLSEEEGQIYVSMKKTLGILKEYCRRSLNKDDRKKFSTYILAILTYIRQSVVIPILPVANIALSMSVLDDMRSELTIILNQEFEKLNLKEFLDKEDSARSSRINEVLKVLKNHDKPTDKIIIFSCFRTSLDMVEFYVNDELPINIYSLTSKQSLVQRGKIIEDFQKSDKNSVLFVTYELGAEGLNLQCANVVMILDFWWNQAKISQAIARVIRTGQLSKEVDIYFFTSNTGIEKALFSKQLDKLILLDEIKNGRIKSDVKTLNIQEVLKLIDSNENYKFLTKHY
jgi:SNF2 family DNA or RNA helicase